MYSISGRLNFIVYNVMLYLALAGLLNHLSVFYGHKIGIRDGPVELHASEISFQLREVDQFLNDRYSNEEALSFTFDMYSDLEPLFNWNTNMIFASLVCEFKSRD